MDFFVQPRRNGQERHYLHLPTRRFPHQPRWIQVQRAIRTHLPPRQISCQCGQRQMRSNRHRSPMGLATQLLQDRKRVPTSPLQHHDQRAMHHLQLRPRHHTHR